MPIRFIPRKFTAGKRSALLAPAILFLVCLIALAFLWRAIVMTEEHRLQMSTEITAEQIQLRIEAWIDDRAAILSHFALQWPDLYLNDPVSFSDEAQGFLDLYPGFQALNFVDRDWIIRVVVPVQGNQPALGKDLHDHPFTTVHRSIEKAIESGETVRTSLIDLLQGGAGFATYSAVSNADGELIGIINGVFKISGLIDNCLAEKNLRDRFCYALVSEDGRTAYEHNWQKIGPSGKYMQQREVRIVDKAWTLKLSPSYEEELANRSAASEILIGSGVLASLILALLLRVLMQRQVELKVSREKYRLLVDNQADFILKLDDDCAILFASPTYCRFVGARELNLLGKSFFEMLYDEDREIGETQLRKLLVTSGNSQFELRGLSADGFCWLSISASTIVDEAGNIEGLICVGRDITLRRELENQLLKSQKLQAVGQLAGGIAHDFNNIMQAVQGYLGFVKAELVPGSRAYSDMEEAELAATRASALTRQLLSFSRQQAMMPVNLDLNDVVNHILSMLERVIGESIRLEFKPQSDLDLVRADRGQIEQILVNLCVNARDAIQHDGTITITTADSSLDESFCSDHAWALPGEYIRLSVRDTGIGMNEDLQKQIFDPFFTTKETGSGTGLGLSTLYGIVQQHNGLVSVESSPGRGTTMSVYLPRAEGVKASMQTQLEEDFKVGRETILVAEDEDMVRGVTVRILSKAGYKVIEAVDGFQAMALLEERIDEIDLAFLDVMMPRMTGHDVSQKLRRDHPEMRILLTSGYDSELNMRHPDEDGSIRLLPKPYNQSLLLKTVRDVLDSTP